MVPVLLPRTSDVTSGEMGSSHSGPVLKFKRYSRLISWDNCSIGSSPKLGHCSMAHRLWQELDPNRGEPWPFSYESAERWTPIQVGCHFLRRPGPAERRPRRHGRRFSALLGVYHL